MSNDRALRDKAREAIRTGKLPNRRPKRTWGGRGSGVPCTLCAEIIQPDEVEIELEFASFDPGNGQIGRHSNGHHTVGGNGHTTGNGNGHANGHSPVNGSAHGIVHNGFRSSHPDAETGSRPENAHVHLHCFTAWEFVRQEILVDQEVSGLPRVGERGTISGDERRASPTSESGDSGGSH